MTDTVTEASFDTPQYMLPSRSTEIVMFSGFVTVGMFTALGSSTFTAFVMTGIVTRKMISSTSMMSTSGVVLISLMMPALPSSAPSPRERR